MARKLESIPDWNEKYHLDTSDFIDPVQADMYKKFAIDAHENSYNGRSLSYPLHQLKLELADKQLDDITWNWLIANVEIVPQNQIQIFIKYFLFIVKKGMYHGYGADFIFKNIDRFERMRHNGGLRKGILTYSNRITPYSFFMQESRSNAYMVYIPNADETMYNFMNGYFDFIKEFIQGKAYNKWGVFRMVNIVFANYQGNLSRPEDYNDNTFIEQFNIITKHFVFSPTKSKSSKQIIYGQLVGFYLYIQRVLDPKIRDTNFKLYDSTILKYQNLNYALNNGYTVVNYNIYGSVPEQDKLLINPKDMKLRGSGNIDHPIMFDVTPVANRTLRKWVKECFWFDMNHNFSTRPKKYSPLIKFLSLVANRIGKAALPKFSLEDVLTYKQQLFTSNITNAAISGKLSMVRFFFKYLEKKNYIIIDPLLYRMLQHVDNPDHPYTEAFTKEEIHALSDAYRQYADENSNTIYGILYQQYYYIFQILCASNIRLSNLLETKVDSLKPTLTRNYTTEYVLEIKSKTSGDGMTRYNITNYVKELIVEVSKQSAELRSIAMGPEKDYIFIYQRSSYNAISFISATSFRLFHKKMCKNAKVRILPVGAIRNFYEQTAGKELQKIGYPTGLVEAVTGHTVNVQNKYYDKLDIVEFCERFYTVEIGSIHIAGQIKASDDASDTQTVMDGCGHCELDHCLLKGNLECFMCEHFVATIKNIPYFEQMVKQYDNAILSESMQHEKEFLNTKKSLCVAYLSRLYTLKEKYYDER